MHISVLHCYLNITYAAMHISVLHCFTRYDVKNVYVYYICYIRHHHLSYYVLYLLLQVSTINEPSDPSKMLLQ